MKQTFVEVAKYLSLHFFSINAISREEQRHMDNISSRSGYTFLVRFLNSLDNIKIDAATFDGHIYPQTTCHVTVYDTGIKTITNKKQYKSIW